MNTNLNNFFADTNILITGGTGLIGKVLVEKLLRSQTNIKKLYLLIRPKNGKSVNERAEKDIFRKPIFEHLKKAQPQFMEKIEIVSGDIGKAQLGLSGQNKELLAKEINIVFNCAASLNMDTSLKENIQCNIISVIHLLKLCREMPNLKSVVIVSTAYSNCTHSVIEEKFYNSPISPDLALKMCNEMNSDMLEEITPTLLRGHPNTYTFSKCIMENMLQCYTDLPIIIFRPAIVISSYMEPLAGWIDNIQGPVGLSAATALGILRTVQLNENVKVNFVPLDLCTNAVICSSWHGIQNRSANNNEIQIYNYSGDKKKWSYGNIFGYINQLDIKSERSIWKQEVIFTSSTYVYNVLCFLLHTLPALFLDVFLFFSGSKLRLTEIYQRKIYPAAKVLRYFTVNEWTIKENNTYTMWNSLSEEDQKRYFFDCNSIDYEKWLRNYAIGIKIFIFKESMEKNYKAIRKQKIFTVLNYALLLILFGFILWSLSKICFGS